MPSPSRRAGDAWRRVRRAVLTRRRPLAAVLTFAAVVAALHTVRPPPPRTVPMTVAARDLAAGTVLTPADLTRVDVPPEVLPRGALADPASARLAGPVRRGEPLTDDRVLGPGLAAGHPELTALPVRFPDAGMVALLHVGDRIDLLAADPQGTVSRTVASDVLVLGLPGDGTGEAPGQQGLGAATAAGLSGRLVVLGVPETDVTETTQAAVGAFLTYAWAG